MSRGTWSITRSLAISEGETECRQIGVEKHKELERIRAPSLKSEGAVCMEEMNKANVELRKRGAPILTGSFARLR